LSTTGVNNTANCGNALYSNTTGDQNTASGVYTLFGNTTGRTNTATGAFAMSANTTGTANTAIGWAALLQNTAGGDNTVIGELAMYLSGTNSGNTAVGSSALISGGGDFNTALGVNAGSGIIRGIGNVCIGEGVFGEAFVDDSTYIRNVNTTEQGPANDVAFVTVRLSDGRLGHQPTVMRSASSELQKTVDEL
jgi:hypothetical protein